MTATSQIVYDAFRQSNLIALGASLTDAQVQEAVRNLNRLVKSTFGNEASEELDNMPLGKQNIHQPSGFPFWDPSGYQDWFVPKDTRLLLNLTSPLNLYLDPAPNDGTRFAVVNVSTDLAANPVIVYGNGRLIDGVQSVQLLSTPTTSQEWFYRDDLATWVQYTPLQVNNAVVPAVDSLFPFPEEFDDFFITMLALRLNPTYGAAMDPQSQAILTRSNKQFKARYTQIRFVRPERGVRALPMVSADRRAWGTATYGRNATADFNNGRTRY